MPDMRDLPRTPGQAVLVAGLLAGVLDILAALGWWAIHGISPESILQGIAGGLLGADAYGGGWATAALGLALHFAIMFVIAAVFVMAGRRLSMLARRPWLSGIAFGIAVYFVMNGIVLPLSAFPHAVSFAPARLLPAMIIQILFVGLPIAWVNRRLYSASVSGAPAPSQA